MKGCIRLLSLQMNAPHIFGLSPGSYEIPSVETSAQRHEFPDMSFPVQMMNYNPHTLLDSDVCYSGQILGQYVQDEGGLLRTRCGCCQKFYKGKLTLVRHWKQMHGLQGGYCCQACGKLFGQKSNFTRHHASCTDLTRRLENNIVSDSVPDMSQVTLPSLSQSGFTK